MAAHFWTLLLPALALSLVYLARMNALLSAAVIGIGATTFMTHCYLYVFEAASGSLSRNGYFPLVEIVTVIGAAVVAVCFLLVGTLLKFKTANSGAHAKAQSSQR